MRIRCYEPGDCGETARLFYDTVHQVTARDYTQEQRAAWAPEDMDLERWNASFLGHRALIAEMDGRIVGFGDMDETGYLDRLYVHKDYQNRGIAGAVCDALERAVGTGSYTTHASITAKAFFENRGYRVVKEQQVERRGVFLTNYVMKKETRVKIRNLILGEDIPKICVPLTGNSREEILEQAREAEKRKADILEWRMDFWKGVCEAGTSELLKELRTAVGELPLLATFRTKAEGGEQEISMEAYRELYGQVLKSGCADAIDVELFQGEKLVRELIKKAGEYRVKVILSSHDFEGTPSEAEMERRIRTMQALGGDVAKLAVMPADGKDVLKVLSVTEKMKRRAGIPIITMSMGRKGMVSRILGETFGSALTFANAGRASAPGQIPLEDMRLLLETLHRHH